MADLANEVWVETTIEEMAKGAPPRRPASPLEAYKVLTRGMLEARKKGYDLDDYYCDRLDGVWDAMSDEVQLEARKWTAEIIKEYPDD